MNSILLGRRIANVLHGAWRSDPPPLLVEPFSDLAELLQDEGLSGLVWNRLAPASRRTALGRDFRKGAYADVGSAVRLDARLVEQVQSLREAGIEPIVTKGWAVARYYPNPGMRPYSDLDIAVSPEQESATRNVLAGSGYKAAIVDLHIGISDLAPAPWREVFARSRLVSLDGCPIRVLSPEDQFRLLVAHLLRHFCHRPLNLVDVAVMLEHEPELDWQKCLRGTHAWRRWVLAVTSMANRFLGTRLPKALANAGPSRPPAWLEKATLWHWGGGEELERSQVLRQPAEWWPMVAYRSLNIVRWPYRFGMPPIRLPQPIWAAAVFGRGMQPINRLWKGIFRRRKLAGAFQTHKQPVF
jgi:hypothetical protein